MDKHTATRMPGTPRNVMFRLGFVILGIFLRFSMLRLDDVLYRGLDELLEPHHRVSRAAADSIRVGVDPAATLHPLEEQH